MRRGLFEAVPDALLVVDATGRILEANAKASDLFGYPPGGLAGLGVEALVPACVRDRHRDHRRGYMERPHMRPMGAGGQDLVGQRRDGVQFPVEIALSPLEGEDGPNYLASIRDVSASQRVRQALVRARYDALVARVGQMALESDDDRGVIDRIPTLLAEALDIETVAIVFVSPGEVEIRAGTGIEPGRLPRAVAAEPLPASWPLANPLIVDDLSSSGSEAAAFPAAMRGQGSGVVMPLFDRARPMGELIAVSRYPRHFDHDALHLLQSVANLIAALGQRRRSEEQLAHSQRLDAIGQLTGGVAHDLNNLLTVMSGNLQMLEDECGDRPAAGALIASALRAVAQGSELTGKLLAFARRQRLVPRAVEPRRLLQELEVLLRRTLGDSVRLQVDIAGRLPQAFVDPGQLDAALLNLALNARDALPGGGRIAIEARATTVTPGEAAPGLAAGRYVVFSVLDSGIGMVPEVLDRAVEPFFTTKEAGRGTGLGLSMVYGFARQSGGHLRIDSAPGRGTRVDLWVPAIARKAAKAVAERLPRRRGQGGTVLLVEDDPDVRGVAAAFLRLSGYAVHAVATAEAALDALASEAGFVAMFSDVMLGEGMNGKALARAGRVLRPGLAIVLASGYEDSKRTGSAARDIEVLRKPYLREQLADALGRALVLRPRVPGTPASHVGHPAPAPAGRPGPRARSHARPR